MFIIFPCCTFKCDKECGRKVCQNSSLANAKIIDIPTDKLVQRYLNNPITHSIVCGGLEPFDTWEELLELIQTVRKSTNDQIVIYTGYTEQEISDKIKQLQAYPNITVKFGRFIPDCASHFDEVLGVTLSSPNQYAKEIS